MTIADLAVDLGFRVGLEDRFRLLGIDAPELGAADPEPGQRSKAELATLLPAGSVVTVHTQKDRREVRTVALPADHGHGVDVCQAMVDSCWAKSCDGKGKQPT